MNFFEKIKLNNFRNFKEFSISLNNQCNVLIGPNGSGKTNFLESISLFEKGRGFRKDMLFNMINNSDKNNIFSIKSIFNTNENNLDLTLTCELNENKLKKKLFVNGSGTNESIKYFEKMYSIIWFLPEMERLFLGSPSLRRNFFDRLIYNVNKEYLVIVSNYKKKILERNNILKEKKYDPNWVYQLEKEIVDLGLCIYSKRNEHISILNSEIKILPTIKANSHIFELRIIDEFYNNLEFKKIDLKEEYLSALKLSRNYDSLVGGCKIGPHKSDIQGFHIGDNLNLSFCSTGQQKTSILIIMIVQSIYLKINLNKQPILLFDEVCSHLDKFNRDILLELINSLNVQTFFTGTEKNFFSFLSTKASYYYINR